MTVSTTTNRISYTGDGVSVAFTVPFLFLANADISVYVAGVQVTTGFTTTGQGVGSGTVTFVTAPANGALVVLVRIPDFLQNTALPSNGPFPATSVETMSDKSMIGLQRLQDLQGRSLVLSDGDAAATLTLPLKAARAGSFLAFDSNGLPIAASGSSAGTVISAAMTPVVQAATLAAGRSAMGTATSGDIGSSGLTQATATILGRQTAGTGAPEQLTAAQVKTLIGSAATGSTGVVQLATNAEAQAGTETAKAITPSTMKAAQIVLGTAVASTSGTSIDFTGIPSYANRVNVLFVSVSTSGTSVVGIQAGTSSGAVTSGYLDAAGDVVGAAAVNSTIMFPTQTVGAAGHSRHGKVTLERVTGNTWVATGVVAQSSTGQVSVVGGSIALAAALDRVRITTAGGADTFDAGTINVSWE